MCLLILWLSLQLAALLTACTAHVVPLSGVALTSRQQPVKVNLTFVDPDTIRMLGYEFSKCGSVRSFAPKLGNLLTFFFHFKPNLEEIIADAQQGINSKHGFAAFFKSNLNIQKVVNAYRPLLEASPVIVNPERADVIKTWTPQPRFTCIDESDPESADIMAQCNKVIHPGYPHRWPLVIHPGTEQISVCPFFFQLEQCSPVGGHYCPRIGANGKFRPGDGSLLESGFAYVVYALVVLYNRNLYESHTEFNAWWDMQYAVELSAKQSLLNAESFGFYAGGELFQMKLRRDELY